MNHREQPTRLIKIMDTTLRDGEQSPGASLRPDQKIRLARQLAKLGVDIIEPGFPVASPGEFAAVQAISRELEGVEIVGFVRAVKADIDAAVEATREAERRRLHLFISSSQIHLDFQLRKSREEAIRLAREMVAYAKERVERIQFSPMDATRTGEEFLLEMVEAVIAEGATIINLPDTVDYALPDEYGAMFRRVREGVRGADRVEFSAHCHNDLGLAVANSLAAIRAGASQVEVTVNGIGERAGNCALEELVMALETRQAALGANTRIRHEQIYETSRMVSSTMHMPVAPNKPIVGRNTFRHESGIHQDGLLKNRRTYEIMDPERLGVPHEMIVLGKHSGRHALRHCASVYGVELDDLQLNDVYALFKRVADDRKTVTAAELMRLIGRATGRVVEPFALAEFRAVDGGADDCEATVAIRWEKDGHVRTETVRSPRMCEAVVDAVCRACGRPNAALRELEVTSMASSGNGSHAEAAVTLEWEGRTARGTAIAPDPLKAIAEACVTAFNETIRPPVPV